MSSEVQIAVIDQQDTQIVLAVPGVQGATGSNIPTGGTANQVLRKASGTNYDTDWSLVTNAMVDSSAAIAGTKISPNFGSQNVVTTGTSTAASFTPTSSSVPTNGVYLPSANNVAISTNGTGRLFVDASGRVGIGSAPGALLDLAASNDGATGTTANNTLRFTDTDANTAADQPIGKIEWYSADTSSPGARAVSYIMSSAAGANSGGDIRFGISANAGTATEAARIDSSGRLLVGTFSTSVASTVVLQGNSSAASTQAILILARGVNNPLDAQLLGSLNFSDSGHAQAAAVEARRDGGTWTSGTSHPSRLVFSTTADGASSPTERMRITSDAYVRLASGTGGIQFNGDTAAANALDDYEEGTWTPAWSFAGGGSIVTDALSATYTKIGRMVYISCDIRTNTPSSPSGAATLTGLPFSGQGRGITIGYTRRWATDMPNLKAYTNAGIVVFTKHASNAVSESALDASDFSATTSYNNLSIAGCYVV
jgi:hypothetical protein